MPGLVDQLLALRIPPDLRNGPRDELDAHIQKNIIGSLRSLSQSKLANGDSNVDPLAVLDPFADSLCYLYILNSQIQLIPTKSNQTPQQYMPGAELWQKVARFVYTFDPLQMRYAGKVWFHLIDAIIRMARLGKSGDMTGTQLLAQAMLRLDPSCGTLTSSHLDLVNLCLETSNYGDAVPVLDRDIHSLPTKSHQPDTFLFSSHTLSNSFLTVESQLTNRLDRNNVMEYYLKGAMIYSGCRHWEQARYFLEHIISTPTAASGAASATMVEAYKKWILVGLMSQGRVGSVPKAANGNAVKTLRSLSKAYDAIADAFQHADRSKLVAEVDEAQQLFAEDKNLGMVQQVLQQYTQLSVRRLGDIYAAVPLSRIASEYNENADNMEAYLQSMIREGHLKARIEQGSGEKVLRFAQSRAVGGKTEAQSKEELVLRTRKIEELATHVGEADRRLSLSKEYLEMTSRKQKAGNRDGAHDEGMEFGGRPVSEGDEDENMMTDVG